MNNTLPILPRAVPLPRLLALLGLALLCAGALVAATTGPARAQTPGALTLTPTSGTVTTNPMLSATTPTACPEGFQGIARLTVRAAGNTALGANLAPVRTSGLAAPFTIAANRSMETTFGPVPDGNYEVLISCFNATGSAQHPDVFLTPIVVTAGAWTAESGGGEEPVATTTTLAVNPAGSATAGAVVTLTATVAPSDAAGSVEFFDGSSSLGTDGVSGGTASVSTDDLVVGPHPLTAVFTPANVEEFEGSTSAAVPYQINAPGAQDTTTTLSVAPQGSAPVGAVVTLNATVAPSAAAGTVEFFDGSSSLGTDEVSGGTASVSTDDLAAGPHELSAVFTPANPAQFEASTSADVTYQINAPEAEETTTALAVSPEGSTTAGAEVTMTATVAPSDAAGSVEFRDGEETLEEAVVADGSAVLTTTELTEGTHTLTAVFSPDDPAEFTGSTSEPVEYEVEAGPEEDLTVTDADGNELGENPTLERGQTVTITARNFAGDEEVEVSLDGTATETATAEDGVVELAFTVPPSLAEGAHEVVFAGAEHEVVFEFTVEVKDTNKPGGGLPLTGLSLLAIAGSGLALTGGGTGLMLLTRRRRHGRPVDAETETV